MRDITADLLKEVCHNVDIKIALQPLSGETFRYATAKVESESRVDISARGVWKTGEREFFDVRVFYPYACSNFKHSNPKSVFTVQENEKKRAYADHICEVEHGSFTPLVFSSTESKGPEATTFYKRLASLLAKNIEKTTAK